MSLLRKEALRIPVSSLNFFLKSESCIFCFIWFKSIYWWNIICLMVRLSFLIFNWLFYRSFNWMIIEINREIVFLKFLNFKTVLRWPVLRTNVCRSCRGFAVYKLASVKGELLRLRMEFSLFSPAWVTGWKNP